MKFDYSELNEIIKSRGIKQNWFANQIGIANTTLSTKLKNGSQFRTQTLFKICKVLNIPERSRSRIFFTPKV